MEKHKNSITIVRYVKDLHICMLTPRGYLICIYKTY